MTSRFRAVTRRPARGDDSFSFVAPPRTLSGAPGERIATCTGVEVRRRGNKWQAILTFDTEAQEVGRLWVELPEPLRPGCRYLRLVSLVLGREPEPGAPIHPGNVFVGKKFMVFVGWRKSQRPAKGKQIFRDDLAFTGPKDPGDFLRIHDLIQVIP